MLLRRPSASTIARQPRPRTLRSWPEMVAGNQAGSPFFLKCLRQPHGFFTCRPYVLAVERSGRVGSVGKHVGAGPAALPRAQHLGHAVLASRRSRQESPASARRAGRWHRVSQAVMRSKATMPRGARRFRRARDATSDKASPSACIHRWLLDEHNHGVCGKCGAERQFHPWGRLELLAQERTTNDR